MATEKNQFDIIRHKLVPIHTIVSDEESKKILDKYKMKYDQFPKILDTDPVSISIGAKPGQIVKIIRKSQTAKEAVAYRLVVESNK